MSGVKLELSYLSFVVSNVFNLIMPDFGSFGMQSPKMFFLTSKLTVGFFTTGMCELDLCFKADYFEVSASCVSVP